MLVFALAAMILLVWQTQIDQQVRFQRQIERAKLREDDSPILLRLKSQFASPENGEASRWIFGRFGMFPEA